MPQIMLARQCKLICKYYSFYRGCFNKPTAFHDSRISEMLYDDDIFVSMAYDFKVRAVKKWIAAFCDENSDIYFINNLSSEVLPDIVSDINRIFGGYDGFILARENIVSLNDRIKKTHFVGEDVFINFNFYNYSVVAEAVYSMCLTQRVTAISPLIYDEAHSYIKRLRRNLERDKLPV